MAEHRQSERRNNSFYLLVIRNKFQVRNKLNKEKGDANAKKGKADF